MGMVQDVLNKVCARFEGCDTLAYADLSTDLVLATNDDSSLPRDTLNTLCAEARVVLNGGDLALIGTAKGFRIFLRAASEPDDGLICICDLGTDVEAVVPAAQACLAELTRGVAEA